MTHPTTAEAKYIEDDAFKGEILPDVRGAMTGGDKLIWGETYNLTGIHLAQIFASHEALQDKLEAMKNNSHHDPRMGGYTVKSAPPAPSVGPIATSNVRKPQPPTEDKRAAGGEGEARDALLRVSEATLLDISRDIAWIDSGTGINASGLSEGEKRTLWDIQAKCVKTVTKINALLVDS